MPEFDSFADFSRHIMSVAKAIPKETLKAVEKIGRNVESDAKEKIGYYQEASGPFEAWQPLADGTLKHHSQFGVGDSPLIISGELYASIQKSVEQSNKTTTLTVGSDMDIGFWQEIGTKTIPPRPFIGPAMYENEASSQKILGEAVEKAFLKGA